MYPAASGGRVRTRSQHDGGEIVTTSAIQDTTPQQQDGGSSTFLERSRNEAARAGAEAGAGSITDDLNHVVIDTSTSSTSFCPAIIAPTVAPSALAAAQAASFDNNPVAAAARSCAGGDSFLGFGFDASPKEAVWEKDGTVGGSRGRAPSSDNVDLGGGGCDLGWGELDADTDITSSRERGREAEEEGYAFDAEGR